MPMTNPCVDLEYKNQMREFLTKLDFYPKLQNVYTFGEGLLINNLSSNTIILDVTRIGSVSNAIELKR